MLNSVYLSHPYSSLFIMKAYTLLLFALICCGAATAQSRSSFTVKAGSTIKETLPPEELLLYPAFRPGKVYYKDNKTSSGRLNYHKFFDEILFIAPQGDTLAVDNEPTIRYVVIEKDTFYFQEGYIKLITTANGVKLGEKRTLKITDRQQIGGYDQPTSSSAITSYKTFNDGRQVYDLTVKEDLIITKEVDYYFGDRWDRFLPANKKNVLDLFAKKNEALKNYLKDTKVDYGNKDDVQKLFLFVAQF